MRVTICALFYGDHPRLAKRCLDSLAAMAPGSLGRVFDYRLALAEACEETRRLVFDFGESQASERGTTTRVVESENVGKYPFMRLMLHGLVEPAEAVMWLDDDSFFDASATLAPAAWWARLERAWSGADVLGQFWFQSLRGKQWEWIRTQPWFNPDVGPPPDHKRMPRAVKFCQGAWWVARWGFLKKHDWPALELRHNGGDSMLGELCRHQRARMTSFDVGVRINADEQGRHSKSKRRGVSEKHVGQDYAGTPLPTDHQIRSWTYREFTARE